MKTTNLTDKELTVKSVIADVYIIKANIRGAVYHIVTVIDKNGYAVTAGVFDSANDAENAAGMLTCIKEYNTTKGAVNIHEFRSHTDFKNAIINAFKEED